MKKALMTMAFGLAALLGLLGAGCGGHEHSADPSRETAGGAYTCPRHGGSYGSANDHCKTCGNHVQKK